ncbi:hypothetical protein ACSTHK_23590, partial [Vibrio parahaemolyticus]
SAAPLKAKPGSSWLGWRGVRLRRLSGGGGASGPSRPTPALRLARTLWELCRFVPVVVTCAIGLGVIFTLAGLWDAIGPVWTLLLS